MKVKAFFSRVTPFYLIPGDADLDLDGVGFDAYPVEVEQDILDIAVNMRNIKDHMDNVFLDMPAPEDAAQDEADLFALALNTAVLKDG